MEWWQALILGLIQGVTEWLPISSSGHLALARATIGLPADVAMDLMLHLATLLVVVWVLRVRIVGLLRDPRTAVPLIVGSVPIAIIGFLASNWVEAAFSDLRVVAAGFALTTTALLLAGRGGRELVDWRRGLIVGLAQVLALIPGASRSGMTLSAGLRQGVERSEAGAFAFLLAVPAIAGATLFQALSFESGGVDWPSVAIGMVAATVAGALSLKWMLQFVASRNIRAFAPYCALMAAVAMGLWLSGIRL